LPLSNFHLLLFNVFSLLSDYLISYCLKVLLSPAAMVAEEILGNIGLRLVLRFQHSDGNRRNLPVFT
jgi:hypothetical protein